MHRTPIRIKQTNAFLSTRLINLFCSILLLTSCFVSCKKEGKQPGTDNGSTGFIDTGSNITGATALPAMQNGTILNTTFESSAPITLNSQHDLTIDGITTSRISLIDCHNITIRNCRIGPNAHSGINLDECTNIIIDSCYISQVSTGIYAVDSQTISVTNCQAENMLGPFPEGQFVQFKNVSGGGNRVSFNKFEDILGESDAEDAISMFESNGLPSDPIVIESNWIRGGGPSHSGGGIMLGDQGGSNIVAKNNILVDPGQYGMAVSGGSYMSIVNNTIYAKAQSFTNVGLYYRNYYGSANANISIAKNRVSFTDAAGALDMTYLGPGDPAPKGWNTNIYDAGLNETLLPDTIVSKVIF